MSTYPLYSISPEQRAVAAAGRAAYKEMVRRAYAACKKAPTSSASEENSKGLEPNFDFWGSGSELLRWALYNRLRYNSPRRKTPGLTDRGTAERSDLLSFFPCKGSMNSVWYDHPDTRRISEVLDIQFVEPSDVIDPAPPGYLLVRMPAGYYLDSAGLYIGDILIAESVSLQNMAPAGCPEALRFGFGPKGLNIIRIARYYVGGWLKDPKYLAGPTDGDNA